MRAGLLRHLIEITHDAFTVNEYGTPEPVAAGAIVLRAELVSNDAQEFLNGGAGEKQRAVFRTRFVDGITSGQTVTFRDEEYTIAEVIELGRMTGLELRCERQVHQ